MSSATSYQSSREKSETHAQQWAGPAKISTVVNGLTFRSDFDSGNLMKVLLPAEQGGAGGVYQLWTARDCEGGVNMKRNSSWFHFGIAGGSKNQIITMRLMNLNNQSGLYKHGMTPVFRVSENCRWARLKQKVFFEENGRHLQLEFQFRFTRDLAEVFFAFCFPHSYAECQRDLDACEDKARREGMAVQPLLVPKPGPTGYFHRELLIRTPEGRRVDLVTITDCHGMLDEREPRINHHLFPELPSRRRPLEFEGKDVVFVSARVHPGETPASFVMQGILRFLLDANDPRSTELRRRFVFKLVPMLNPDGVAAGHFRQDSHGNNLNRHYTDPNPEIHASVFGAKSVVMHHAARQTGRGRLTLYLDLHAHASTRGCFMYGNHLPGLEHQAENQLLPLLMALNTPHFDFSSCNFTLKHMSRVDSGDGGLSAEGTGRVFYGRHAGVLRSYTLECNYNTGKGMCNHIPPAHGRKGENFPSPERKETPPPKYNPDTWRDVGQGVLKALLDAEGALIWSRLPLSRFRSLERARTFLINELRSQPSYREQSLQLRRRSSASSTPGNTPPTPQSPPPPRPRPPPGPVSTSATKQSPLHMKGMPPSSSTCTSTKRGGEPPDGCRTSAVNDFPIGGGSTPSPRIGRKSPLERRRARSQPPPPLLPKRPGRRSTIESTPARTRFVARDGTAAVHSGPSSPRQHSRSTRGREDSHRRASAGRTATDAGSKNSLNLIEMGGGKGIINRGGDGGRNHSSLRAGASAKRLRRGDGSTSLDVGRSRRHQSVSTSSRARAVKGSASGGGGSRGSSSSSKKSTRTGPRKGSSGSSSNSSRRSISSKDKTPRRKSSQERVRIHAKFVSTIVASAPRTDDYVAAVCEMRALEAINARGMLPPASAAALVEPCEVSAAAGAMSTMMVHRNRRRRQPPPIKVLPLSDTNHTSAERPAPGWELKP